MGATPSDPTVPTDAALPIPWPGQDVDDVTDSDLRVPPITGPVALAGGGGCEGLTGAGRAETGDIALVYEFPDFRNVRQSWYKNEIRIGVEFGLQYVDHITNRTDSNFYFEKFLSDFYYFLYIFFLQILVFSRECIPVPEARARAGFQQHRPPLDRRPRLIDTGHRGCLVLWQRPGRR